MIYNSFKGGWSISIKNFINRKEYELFDFSSLSTVSKNCQLSNIFQLNIFANFFLLLQ